MSKSKMPAAGQIQMFRSHAGNAAEAVFVRIYSETREKNPVMGLDVVDHQAQILRQRTQCIVAAFHTGTGRVECSCCGASDWQALQLDHVNGDGKVDRDARREARDGDTCGAGVTFWRIVDRERERYPYRLQLLCEKCNRSKGRSRTCKIHGNYLGRHDGEKQ